MARILLAPLAQSVPVLFLVAQALTVSPLAVLLHPQVLLVDMEQILSKLMVLWSPPRFVVAILTQAVSLIAQI